MRLRSRETHAAISRAFEALSEPLPYALFRVHGKIESLTRAQFEQALRDARLCRCGECLCCRAKQYAEENGL